MELQKSILDENSSFVAKFVTVEGKMFITKPNDTKTLHAQLAIQDGIRERVDELRKIKSPEVDGGLINVNGQSNILSLFSHSESLGIPRVADARIKSAEVAKQIFPDFTIISPNVDIS